MQTVVAMEEEWETLPLNGLLENLSAEYIFNFAKRLIHPDRAA